VWKGKRGEMQSLLMHMSDVHWEPGLAEVEGRSSLGRDYCPHCITRMKRVSVNGLEREKR
jgi:hypothetical protein